MIELAKTHIHYSDSIAQLEHARQSFEAAKAEVERLQLLAKNNGVDPELLSKAPTGMFYGEELRPWRRRGYTFLADTMEDMFTNTTRAVFWPVAIEGKTRVYNETQLQLITDHVDKLLKPDEFENLREYSAAGRYELAHYLQNF